MREPGDLVGEALRAVDRVIVLGASGWFGRTAVDLLDAAYGDDRSTRSALFARRPHKIGVPGGEVLEVRPLAELATLDGGPRTLLLDCAYPTQDQVVALGAGSYVEAVLDLRASVGAALERIRPTACISLSSGAARVVAEGRPAAPRTRIYGAMKRLDELTMLDRCPELGVRLCIARVYAASGPHMTKPGTYALGDLIAQARRGGPLEVRAAHPVRRSYMLAEDVLAIAILAALEADPGAPVLFETGGEVIELGELARRVGVVVCGSELEVRRPRPTGASADEYVGDPTLMEELARAHGVRIASLDEQIAADARRWLEGQAGAPCCSTSTERSSSRWRGSPMPSARPTRRSGSRLQMRRRSAAGSVRR